MSFRQNFPKFKLKPLSKYSNLLVSHLLRAKQRPKTSFSPNWWKGQPFLFPLTTTGLLSLALFPSDNLQLWSCPGWRHWYTRPCEAWRGLTMEIDNFLMRHFLWRRKQAGVTLQRHIIIQQWLVCHLLLEYKRIKSIWRFSPPKSETYTD